MDHNDGSGWLSGAFLSLALVFRSLTKQQNKYTAEQKKMVLVDRYSKLGEKELDRVLARKRKHKAAKERKNMPWVRRGADARYA